MNITDNIYTKIFSLIKNNKWDDLLKLINDKNNDIDVNMRDKNNNYIISYAVINNRLDIIKLLVEKNARIDILDSDDRTILYYPIKYGYDDILDYLLEINKDLIGVNIINIRDKTFKTPLHYTIINKNTNALKKLLDNGANPNYVDNKGYNLLHHAIFSRDESICSIIIPYIADINMKTNGGDTALHFSCNLKLNTISKLLIDNGINVNIQDSQHEFSALHYAVNMNSLEIIEYILKHDGNPNLQDIFGNSSQHYAVIEQYYNIIDIILAHSKIIPNFNLYNIDGKIPLHIFLENYIPQEQKYLELLLPLSNLSITNNDGNSCLFLLCLMNLWKKYKDILKTKRLDIFTKNKKNKTVLDIIDKKDYDEFIDLVAESYLSRLKASPDNWVAQWENICSNDFKLNDEVYMNELKTVFNKNIKNKNELNNQCINIIKRSILESVDIVNMGVMKCSVASYPLAKNKICIKVDEGENLNVCTFTGTTLDVLLGLIYLLQTHTIACSPITQDFYNNENLYNFYKNNGIIMSTRGEFLNFEVIWVNQKLYITEDFFERIDDCKRKAEFIIIPLGIELNNGSHANYIIYDVLNKTVERFEPHGSSTPAGLNYSPALLDEILEARFKTINDAIKYYAPSKFLPKIGFQLMDIFESNRKKIGDPGGFCALWSIWYVDMRIKYKNLPPDELVKILIRSIKTQNISVRNMIRNYAINIIKIRDDVLSNVGIDINDWLNDTYTDDQIGGVIAQIQNMISKL